MSTTTQLKSSRIRSRCVEAKSNHPFALHHMIPISSAHYSERLYGIMSKEADFDNRINEIKEYGASDVEMARAV